MNNKPWRFEAKSNNEVELFLYDSIGSDGFGEGVTAKAFTADLNALGPVSQITVRLNSPGGAVSDGVAIFNSLVSHPARIVTRVDSMAASIASLIAMAGEQVQMCSNAIMMIHLPHVSLYGAEAGELRRMADTLDRVTGNIVSGYARHCKLGFEKIKQLMIDETWMTAAEALDLGFCDQILSEEGDLVSVAARADLTKFRNVPPRLIAAKTRQSAAPVATRFENLDQITAAHQQLLLQRKLNEARYGR